MTSPTLDALVKELRDKALRDCVGQQGIAEKTAEWKAATELTRLATENATLQARMGELAKYCSAAAHDYDEMLRVLDTEAHDTPFSEAFPKAAKELRESSEFMRLAAEGRANGMLYDDELTKAKREHAEAESRAAAMREALGWLIGGIETEIDTDRLTAKFKRRIKEARALQERE